MYCSINDSNSSFSIDDGNILQSFNSDSRILFWLLVAMNTEIFWSPFNLSNKILEEYPNSILINNITGVIQTEINNYDEAKKNYLKAIEIEPNNLLANYNLANLLKRLGDHTNSEFYYKKAIEN